MPLYFLTPSKYRWLLLLTASYYFYSCWKPEYLLILASGTLIDFFLARLIHQSPAGTGKRKAYLLLSLILNIGGLLLFKYLNFFSESFVSLLSSFNIALQLPTFQLLQPVGISYYTFKKISYIVDIYREQQEPSRHLGKFALYLSFFPQLAAGPIDRARDLLPQFDRAPGFNFPRVLDGLKLFVWGLFKKVVIADRLAVMVEQVYSRPDNYPGISLALATLFFSFQVYADFSGYTDMAIGIGQVFGFSFADNFNRPYSAGTLQEFWNRWHMSFTSWLRDYLFLPIAYGLSRRIKTAEIWTVRAETWAYVTGTLSTMLICGLWHGAAWTFVLWGGFHGLLLVAAFATRKKRKKWRRPIRRSPLKKIYQRFRILSTFSLVTFLWIFFRANTAAHAFSMAARILNPAQWAIQPRKEWIKTYLMLGQSKWEILIVLAGLGLMLIIHKLQAHEGMRQMFSQKPLLLRWFLYILLVLAVMNLGMVKEVPFIYFEF